jgi:hypothetical protein
MKMSNSKDPVDIGCLEAMEFFYAWLDNELDGKDVADFEHHLSHCKSCWSRAEVERALTLILPTGRDGIDLDNPFPAGNSDGNLVLLFLNEARPRLCRHRTPGLFQSLSNIFSSRL